jgi:hypothetical protein
MATKKKTPPKPKPEPKKAAPKKAVSVKRSSADAMERNNETAFNKLYTKMNPGGGNVGERDAVVMFRNTAREAIKQGMPISNEARYYVQNPTKNYTQSSKNIDEYFAKQKLTKKKSTKKK